MISGKFKNNLGWNYYFVNFYLKYILSAHRGVCGVMVIVESGHSDMSSNEVDCILHSYSLSNY